MTLDEIQDRLDDDATNTDAEKQALWEAIQKLDEPMRASMISAYLQKYPDQF